MKNQYREFTFKYTYEDTGGLAGKFRFLIPQDSEGRLCLLAPVDSLFKMFIDQEGHLCLTAPTYKDDKVSTELKFPEQWTEYELRGVYRYEYGQPSLGGAYDNGPFEFIKSHFRWSQNGLLVGKLKFEGEMRHRMRQHKADDDKKGDEIADLFKHVPVPGLNAADVDLRGLWQVSLNVQRTDFQRGPLLRAFVERYYSLVAEMWKEILDQAGMLDDLTAYKEFVDALLERADWQLKTQLTKALKYKT